MGQHGGEHRHHGLSRGVEIGSRKPAGLVVGRQLIHEELELAFALYLAGGQPIPHQLEHADDMAAVHLMPIFFGGRQIFRKWLSFLRNPVSLKWSTERGLFYISYPFTISKEVNDYG